MTAETWLQSAGLEDWVASTLVRHDTRPRTVVSGRGALVVLRGINLNPDSDPEDMVSLRIWIEPERIITVRQRKLLSIQAVRDEFEKGEGPKSVDDLLVGLIEKIGDRIASFVDDMEDRLDGLETQVESERNTKTRTTISETRRKIASVRRFLAPQRDALESLYRNSVTASNVSQANRLREQADRIVRYVEDLDLVRERLLVLQEDLMNLLMEEQNSRMYALSIVAVIFLPITFVSGVFGMNVAGLPGLSEPLAFNYVMVGMVTAAMLVVGLLLLKRWL
ncbi:MAG: zinc transporter ZntB [Gammaproteobacteria bacterium]|nr:zinc transporter ZntB [Gammaproteobacteria bacterium]